MVKSKEKTRSRLLCQDLFLLDPAGFQVRAPGVSPAGHRVADAGHQRDPHRPPGAGQTGRAVRQRGGQIAGLPVLLRGKSEKHDHILFSLHYFVHFLTAAVYAVFTVITPQPLQQGTSFVSLLTFNYYSTLRSPSGTRPATST